MNEYVLPIVTGILLGTIARILMLRTDYRQYPTYLHGKIIHIALGFIASGLGAVAVPAVLEKEYAAITFLTIAASQFREVRNMERNTLSQLDEYELVPRGKTYIEGIAIAFESRNYLVIFISLFTTLSYILFNAIVAVIVSVILFFIARSLMSGSTIKQLVDIEHVPVHFEGPGLYIDNIYIMNIGLEQSKEAILQYGMGFILKPKNFDSRSTIANLGQRQAILHDVSVALGVYRDSGTPSLVPLAKRDLDDGRVGLFILPQKNNISHAIEIIGGVPTLESAIRMPTER